MSKHLEINSFELLNKYRKVVLDALESTRKRIEDLSTYKSGALLFHDLRFLEIGQDPLEERPLNFIEQLNQTFTYLTSFKATEYLIKAHAQSAPFILNLGTSPGYDIVSKDGLVIAEVFAATSPFSNDKLKKDCIRVADSIKAIHRYVFYYSPGNHNVDRLRERFSNLSIVQLDLIDYCNNQEYR
jgi:hypothetical protein